MERSHRKQVTTQKVWSHHSLHRHNGTAGLRYRACTRGSAADKARISTIIGG